MTKPRYEVWFQRSIRTFPVIPEHLTYRDIVKKYVLVKTVLDVNRGFSLEEIFTLMQGEHWGKWDSTSVLMSQLPTKHTSMTYQDLIYDRVAGIWYICETVGFTIIDVRNE